jgi:murein DD-endopeptidase MepM/ murein hydrolase activator NlpD
MKTTAFWSDFGRGAVMAAAGVAALALGGCSSSRFDYPPFSMTDQSSNSGANYAGDPTVTGSIPVPPATVYGHDRYYGSNSYGQASYGQPSPNGSNSYGTAYNYGANTGYNNGGAYAAGNDYSSPVNYGAANTYGAYGSPRTARSDLPPAQSRYPATPTPVSYAPDAHGRPPHSDYPVKQAVYTPVRTAPAKPTPSPRRVAMADKASLRGPGSQTITVKSGDSLYLYAARYHVSVAALKEANGMTDMRLTAGQKIVIPASGSTVKDNSYIVQPGDSLNSIAKSHHIDESKLAEINHIADVKSLQVGQELIIPGYHSAAAPHVEAKDTHPQAPAGAGNDVHVVHTTPIASPDLVKTNKASQAQSADKAQVASGAGQQSGDNEDKLASDSSLPNPDPMSGQRFRWPVQGRIISKFGTRADGGHNDGIDLAVPQGTPVKAAENGVVAYAGDELKGYGNLVLIRHANNWVTAYAHNENLLVKRGDKVHRGQVIALAGATGAVSQPELHFELRKGARPVDPLDYMSSTAASND